MLLIAIALVQAAPFDVKASPLELMKTHCRGEWPDNFRMQTHCLKQAAEGAIQFKEVHEELGQPLQKALENCVEEWTKDRVPNFNMIGYCATKQAEAYRSLNAPPKP